MSALGDPFCLLAFASNGRDDVEMTSVKAFDETYDRACVSRLAGLSAACRHGSAPRFATPATSSVTPAASGNWSSS